MILSESKIRRIIKEELRRELILLEAAMRVEDLPSNLVFEFKDVDDDLIKLGVWEVKGDRFVSKKGEMTVRKLLDPDLPCAGSWQIDWIESFMKGQGLGPLMYDAMIEYIRPEPLTSDREKVSDQARRVWKYFLNNRRDLRTTQLDDEEGTLTPKYKIDDCSQTAATFASDPKDKPVNTVPFFQSPLSKAYSVPVNHSPTLDALEARGMLR